MANEVFIPSMSQNAGTDDVVLTTSLADYRKTLVDNVYDDVPILRILNEGGRKRMVDGGVSIVEHIVSGKQTDGGWYSGSDGLGTTQGQNTMLVEFKWQNAYEPIQITRDEERQNSGDMHKLIDLVATKTQLAQKAIADRLEQAVSTPVGEANNLYDLETIVNTGTLGTLQGSTDTFWQSTVTTSGAFATQGLTDMTTATYAVSSGATVDNPSVYLTNKTIIKMFWFEYKTVFMFVKLFKTGQHLN